MVVIEMTPSASMSRIPEDAYVYGRKSGRAIEVGDVVTAADGDLVVTRVSLGATIPADAVTVTFHIH